jgi:hypothetical protein
LIEATKTLVNLVFDCFLPEMHEEVISDTKSLTAAVKKSRAKTGNGDATKALAPEEDSEYVQIEPIEKTEPKVENPAQATEDVEMESSLIEKKEAANSKPLSKLSKRKTLIFRDVENASNRLILFNNFCLQNQLILNKLVKNIYGGKQRKQVQGNSNSF